MCNRSNQCRERKRSSSNDRMRKEGRCFKCNKHGHKQRDCKNNNYNNHSSRSRSESSDSSRGSRHSRKRRHSKYYNLFFNINIIQLVEEIIDQSIVQVEEEDIVVAVVEV